MRGLCLIFVLWTVSLHGTGARLQYSDVQKRWALATSAILAEMNGGSHDPLSVFAASELTSDKSRRMLWEQRGVRTRRELLEKIEDPKWSGQMRRNTAPDSGHAASSRGITAAVAIFAGICLLSLLNGEEARSLCV